LTQADTLTILAKPIRGYYYMSIEPVLLKSKEAAIHISYSDDSLRRSRVTGRLGGMAAPKHVKIGRTVRYRVSDLSEWVKNLTQNK
tara:strand:+ start:1789 stop:2046 length:258 start_codon:yes stop_codon:yes gene_type:complete